MRKVFFSKRIAFYISVTVPVMFIIFVLLSLLGNEKLSFSKPGNYFIIKDKILSRSAQPSFLGFMFLRVNGVKSIINLREEEDDSEHGINFLGFNNYLNIKIKDYSVPTDDQIIAFLNFVTNPENQPVHVHCRSGKGRAGLMEVIYRYSVDGSPIRKSINLTRRHHKISDTQIEWLLQWASNKKPQWFSLRQNI
ncbi:MAG: dual specificity protein phosphatase family protein [Candidatus Schekmanbacteria bacterium]|nr:dual specificity protein phosphatase family protein [Candidatus Schekmanbacteria bacterium]